MKNAFRFTITSAAGLCLLVVAGAPGTRAQDPVVTPIIASTAAPIVVNAIKPKPKNTGLAKFEGYFMNGNRAQVTLRAKADDLGIQTFPLSDAAAEKMQQVIDKGGYQYGDRITVYYDPQSRKALKFKGKPSRAL